MSRNTVLSKLSHTAIEHLAHYLFVVSLKYFSGDARKNAFFTASEKFRSNYKSYLSINIRDRFIRFKFLFTQRGKLGLLLVYLIKTAPPVLPQLLIFFLVEHIYVEERLILIFLQNEFSVPRSRMMTSSCRNKEILQR